jgi:hypothetical protein
VALFNQAAKDDIAIPKFTPQYDNVRQIPGTNRMLPLGASVAAITHRYRQRYLIDDHSPGGMRALMLVMDNCWFDCQQSAINSHRLITN